MNDRERSLYTAREIGNKLGMHEQTILRFARRGYIPRVKINSKMIRFDLDEVVRALKHYVTKV